MKKSHTSRGTVMSLRKTGRPVRERLEALFAEFTWNLDRAPAPMAPDVPALRAKLGFRVFFGGAVECVEIHSARRGGVSARQRSSSKIRRLWRDRPQGRIAVFR